MSSSSSKVNMSKLDPHSIAGLTVSIFADFITTITQDIVLEAHRSEKLNRMAAIQTSGHINYQSSSGAEVPSSPTTATAKLFGKALETPYTEEMCPRCQLPRHTVDSFAAVPIPGKKWCTKPPLHDQPGYDIYGNPAASSSGPTMNSKKFRNPELGNDRASPSTDASTTPPASSGTKVFNSSNNTLYVTCTNCPREIHVSRFASHLEKCLGINNRTSARASGPRASNPTTNGVSTPSGNNAASRRNSPAPPSPTSSASNNDDIDNKAAIKGSSANMDKKMIKKKGLSKKEKSGLNLEKSHITSAPRLERAGSSFGPGSPTHSQSGQSTNLSTIKKKKKRKAETLDDDEKPLSMLLDDERERLIEANKDGDDSILRTPTKPLSKKQKHNSITPSKEPQRSASPALAGSVKNQITKFKNRAASPTIVTKKEKSSSTQMHRSQSDIGPKGNTSDKAKSSIFGSPPPSQSTKESTSTITKLGKHIKESPHDTNGKTKDKKFDKEKDKVKQSFSSPKDSKSNLGDLASKKDKKDKSKLSDSKSVSKGSDSQTQSKESLGSEASISPSTSPNKKKITKTGANRPFKPPSSTNSGTVGTKTLPKGPNSGGDKSSVARKTVPG